MKNRGKMHGNSNILINKVAEKKVAENSKYASIWVNAFIFYYITTPQRFSVTAEVGLIRLIIV